MTPPDLHHTITDKQVRAVVRLLMQDGWEFIRISSSNHPILQWPGELRYDPSKPNTGRLVLTSTPSDHRSLRNCLSDARLISGIDHSRLLRDNKLKNISKYLPRL